MVILFIVTSAINGNQIRLDETLQTFESIWQRCPTATIWMAESSLVEPSKAFLEAIPRRVKVIPFWGHDFVRAVHAAERDIAFIKNGIEIPLTIKLLQTVPNRYSHIFKISGRYQLTEHFDLSQHPADKATFRQVLGTGYPLEVVGTDGMLMTRLYSCGYTVIPKVTAALEKIERFLWKQWDEGRVFDIEHGFWKFLDRDILNQVATIGVRGRIGHLSHIVED